MGDKEYKVRHILVEKEDEAKEIIVALQKGEQVREARRALEGPGLEGQRRRPRLECAGQLREAVLGCDGQAAEGQVHDAAGADAVRLARDPGRRHPRREGARLRRSEAAARSSGCRASRSTPTSRTCARRTACKAVAAPGRGPAARPRQGRPRACPFSFAPQTARAARSRAARSMLFLRRASTDGSVPSSARPRHPQPDEQHAGRSACATIRNPKDFWAGLLFIAFGIAAIALGDQLPAGHRRPDGPGLLPARSSASCCRPGRDSRAAGAAARRARRCRAGNGGPLLVVLGSVVVFGLIVTRVGLVLSTILLIVDRQRGEPRVPAEGSADQRRSCSRALAVGVFISGLEAAAAGLAAVR